MSSADDAKREAFVQQLRAMGDIDAADLDTHLKKLVAATPYTYYTGYIYHAGYQSVPSGDNYSVSFIEDGGPGCSGEWPAWAYKLALDALLHGKKIELIADGTPCGQNLIWVAINHQSV